MEFSYGQGEYIEGERRLKGKIILSEHKLYLKDGNIDLPQTYIPLEKIKRVKRTRQGVEVFTRPSLYSQFKALFKGERRYLEELVHDIVRRRGLKKKFLSNEWADTGS